MSHPSCIKIPGTELNPKVINDQKVALRNSEVPGQCTTSHELISIANEVFGEGSWSHSITSQTIDFIDHTLGKYYVGCAAFAKVQLHDGTFHEDMGYSNAENINKGLAVYAARNGSITNALRKVLQSFGGDIEKRIKHLITERSNGMVSNISAVGEPQRNFIKSLPPAAQSTPKKPVSPRLAAPAATLPVSKVEKRALSPVSCSRESSAPVVSTALTEEEMRLERKRRQKQKQEEYRKQMKGNEISAEKPNPRF